MTDVDSVSFRSADREDANRIGAFQVRSWAESYASFLPAWTLGSVTAEDRAEAWRMILDDPLRHDRTRVLIGEAAGAIVALGACGLQRSEPVAALGYDGEISALYVAKDAQSRGVGRRLLRRLFRELAELLTLGVGGRHHALDDVAYGWPRLELAPRPVAIDSLFTPEAAPARPVTLGAPVFAEPEATFRHRRRTH